MRSRHTLLKFSALEDNGFRRVECSEISRPPRIVVKTHAQHGMAAFKVVLGLLQKAVGFRRHRLIPSRLISRMSGELSRYAIAG